MASPSGPQQHGKPQVKHPASKRWRLIRRITRLLDLPMAVLSLVFFGLVVADLSAPPNARYHHWLDEAYLTIWGLFLVEYLIKLGLAPNKRLYARHRWLDLLVLLFPMLRLLRVVRLFYAGFSMVRLGLAMRRGARGLEHFLIASRFGYVAGLTVVVVLASSAAMLALERETPNSGIRTFGDALWWSAAIVTTVASDLSPKSAGGRILAVGMMVYGMSVFGYFVSQAVRLLQSPPKHGRSVPGSAGTNELSGEGVEQVEEKR
ncbi:MAG TPA: ion channel [Stenomitos sp.]